MPPDLALWSESGSSLGDSWAAAEVVALVLLGLGLPRRDPELETPTASIVPELVASGAAVEQLAAINGITRYSRMSGGAIPSEGSTAMAFRLSSHETSVRGRQYPSVATHINNAVLRTPQTATAFQNSLGFSYNDVIVARDALIDLVGRAHEDVFAALAAAAQAGGAPDATARAAAEALFQTPSQLQQVTARQVADRAGLRGDGGWSDPAKRLEHNDKPPDARVHRAALSSGQSSSGVLAKADPAVEDHVEVGLGGHPRVGLALLPVDVPEAGGEPGP